MTQTKKNDFIPILDLTPEIEFMREELDAAYQKVMDHGRFIMGPEVKEFEQSVADYLGAKHAIGVNSGTDALLIALRAASIGKGDEVITTSFTFFATAESIEMAGATPVFVDVREEDYNIDPEKIEDAITEKTRAIVPVHLFGKPAEMDRIMEIAETHELKVIEDCAQSFGATWYGGDGREQQKPEDGKKTGTIGDAGAFSFFPSKNLGGFGDGGMIVTDNDEIAENSRKLRAHGSLKKYHNEMMGYNSRLDTLQAAMLQVKLKYIDRFNRQRREVAHRYMEALSSMEGFITPSLPDDGHVYHQFTIRVLNGKRDDVAQQLNEAGIGTMVYYPVPCHRLPVYQERYHQESLNITNHLVRVVLSLPIGPFVSDKNVNKIIQSLKGSISLSNIER